MATVSLFWQTNMVAVTSCEYVLLRGEANFLVSFYYRDLSHNKVFHLETETFQGLSSLETL